jgi:serine/threonine-protein kinase
VIPAERFSRVDRLFDAALDRPAAERSSWLEEACAGDAGLRVEVEALLRHAESDKPLLESGPLSGPIWDDVLRELESMDDLAPGDRVGSYEIRGLIGRGGMGAVYRAKDATLGREVAIKALTHAFAADASTLRRFEREAKLLASLNHPNIAVIHDLVQVEDRSYLVLELVEGETLAQRLTRGAFELPEVIRIATQLADALEEAHRKGVVHRDLKPSNVKLTPEGRVKVLDFGLAKTDEPALDGGGTTPTAGAPTTRSGVILGTPGYMSPEQVRGLAVDKRSDIWAFGCLVYEMLVGARAFAGATVSDAIAASLREEVAWSRLPRSTPPELERLLRRCLKQDVRERLQDIGDARIELEELLRDDMPGAGGRARTGWRSPVIALALSALFGLLAGAAFLRILGGSAANGGRSALRTSLLVGPGERLWQGATSSLAISPDGSRVVFVGEREGRVSLFVRSLDAYEEAPVRSSEGARDPFFSPDGEWVGFFAGGEMRRVHLASGASSSITSASLQSRGASWGADDRIVFSQDGAKGLVVVPAAGGKPELMAAPDPGDAAEYLWPQWLPGQGSVLFTRRELSASGIADELSVLDLDSGRVRPIGKGTQGVFVPSGYVVYTAGGALEAVGFDLESLVTTGESVRVVESVHGYPIGATSFALSPSGALLYVEPAPTTTLEWIDREGVRTPVEVPRGTPGWPRLSPDGRFAALHVGGPETRDVWLLDLERLGSWRQLTYRGGGFPVWSRDGRRIAFMSRQEGSGDLYVVPADGSGPPARVVSGERTKIPVSWSAEGILAYYEIGERTQRDIWVVDLDGDRIPRPFLATQANELAPVFSPDGRHLAYVSDENGRNEVYVRPFPPPGPVTVVSIGGGSEPVWSRDGSTLFYRHVDAMMNVPVRYVPRFEVGQPAAAIDAPLLQGSGGNPSYDVAADGSRFILLRSAAESSVDELRLVLNWVEDLRGAVRTR